MALEDFLKILTALWYFSNAMQACSCHNLGRVSKAFFHFSLVIWREGHPIWMVYSGGDGSIIGLISHISSRNGGELLMNLITRYKTVRKSYLDKTNHVTQPAGHAGAVKKNLILSHQKNPVNFQLPRSYHKMQERGFRVTLLWWRSKGTAAWHGC